MQFESGEVCGECETEITIFDFSGVSCFFEFKQCAVGANVSPVAGINRRVLRLVGFAGLKAFAGLAVPTERRVSYEI